MSTKAWTTTCESCGHHEKFHTEESCEVPHRWCHCAGFWAKAAPAPVSEDAVVETGTVYVRTDDEGTRWVRIVEPGRELVCRLSMVEGLEEELRRRVLPEPGGPGAWQLVAHTFGPFSVSFGGGAGEH